MLKFSWNMLIADAKRNLRGGWWLQFLLLICMTVLPYLTDSLVYMYFVLMGVMMCQPQFARIYFTLPFDEKKIRQIFIYRIMIVCGMVIGAVLVCLLVCHFLSMPVEVTGYGVTCLEITLFVICSESSLRTFMGGERKFRLRNWFAVLLALVDVFTLPFYGEINAKWLLGVDIIVVILAFFYMLYYLRNLTFDDYVYVPVIWGDNGKTERK